MNLSELSDRLEGFEAYLDHHYGPDDSAAISQLPQALQILRRSMTYSLLGGGKRVRPLVGLLLTEALGISPKRCYPWLTAVEMIHTYSLVHDDLPCMDDDDERRGQPTNHVVFGEAMALLTGDTLQTEAFLHLAKHSVESTPAQVLQAVALLAEASGFSGMAGGQAMDLESKEQAKSLEETLDLQRRKTGALFRVTAEGLGVLSGVTEPMRKDLRQFGESLGLAFQLADDVIDCSHELEPGSLPALIGVDETKKLLADESKRALKALSDLGIQQGPLVDLVLWNKDRKV